MLNQNFENAAQDSHAAKCWDSRNFCQWTALGECLGILEEI